MKVQIEIEGDSESVEAIHTLLRITHPGCVKLLSFKEVPIFQEKNWHNRTTMHFINAICLEFNIPISKVTDDTIIYVQEAFKQKNWVKLIKVCRELSEIGLKEAKDWVEQYLS